MQLYSINSICSVFITLALSTATPCLAGLESPFLYHPRSYSAEIQAQLPAAVLPITFQTSDGQQCAFYVPPAKGPDQAPKRLWVLFNGNASLALDWLGWSSGQAPDPEAGYLLVDYPGYGFCHGKPTAAGVGANGDGALTALAAHLRVEPAQLEKDVNTLGYSLGAAAALQFAVRHPVKKVILLAPFTSIRAMAGQSAGLVGRMLVSQQYDNRARLRELAARTEPPQVLIVHGDQDPVIPVRMGRTLAQSHPQIVDYLEIPGGTHDSILSAAKDAIVQMMRGDGSSR